MPISTTEVIGAGRFSDGIHLRVKLIDHVGKEYTFAQKLPLGSDIDAFIATRVIKFDRNLIKHELRRAVYDEPWDYVLQYASSTQLLAFIREEYSLFEGKKLVTLAKRIEEWLDNGRFTVAEFRSAFGKSNAEFNQFRTRLVDLRDCDDTIEMSKGE